MASTGEDKFVKYFKGKKEVEVVAKGVPKGKMVPVFDSVDSKLSKKTIPDGTALTVIPGPKYDGRYFAKFAGGAGFFSDANVGKPSKSKSAVNLELSRITAADFISGGKSVKFEFGVSVIDCAEFTSAKQLAQSITNGMNSVRGVSPEVNETFTQMFSSSNPSSFVWNSDVTGEEINKFGVYFGELLVGYYALAGIKSVFSRTPWEGRIERFLVPTDPSFSGVDSFMVTEKGVIVPISNKFGVGAAASFFSNLLIKGIRYRKTLKPSVFRDIVDAAISINVTENHLEKKQKAKPILYEYGIRNLLELSKSEVPDAEAVLGMIKQGKNDPARFAVIAKIANHQGIDKRLVDGLEKTTTAFFCREIAAKLMADKSSTDTIVEILTGKNYWQANLHEASWRRGIVKFNIQNSGESRVEIIGSKASMTDLDASQGMINYILK